MGDVANIVSGPAKLFVAPVGTAIPNLTGNVAVFGAAFTDVGFTDKGIEFDYSATDKEIEVDELTSPVDILIDKEKVEVSLVMAETTLENLYFCISGGTLVSAAELTIGGKVRPSEFVLGIHGPGPDGGTRQVVIYRAMPMGSPKVHWQRNDKTSYAAKFRGLASSDFADGANICTIQDF